MSVIELDQIYGRKLSLDLLKRRVLDLKEGYRQNIAFLGERNIGKSSIIHKFIDDLDDNEIIPIYLDLGTKDLNQFYYQFVCGLLYQFALSKNFPVHEDISLLMECTQKELPHTVRYVRKLKSHLSHGRFVEFYRELIDLPHIFTQESNKFCLLIFDEFQNLECFPIPHVFKELGKKIMTQKRCLYIVTSSYPEIAKRILVEKLSLLFGNFEIVPVEPFGYKTSQEFIDDHIKNLKIRDSLRDYLIDFCGGQPLYLHIICQEIKNLSLIHKQDEIFDPLFTQAADNLLFHPWGILSRHFDLTLGQIPTGKGNFAVSAILLALSQQRQKITDLSKDLGYKQNLVTQGLNRLIDIGIVAKNGQYYYVIDKLFRFWLKYVYQRRRMSFAYHHDQLREQFQSELTRNIQEFLYHSKKDFSARIIELLCCFDNDSLHLNGRRYKLPLFEELIPKKIRKISGEYFDAIRAVTPQGDWFIVLKSETVDENDIQCVLAESKKLKQKPQRCLLISLSYLDENARVKALQERMWIWNEGELNTLLNIYDKPFITLSC